MRHIERTKAFLHCISAESENPLESYNVVRKELGLYNKDMLKKPELIVLTKIDLISPEEKRFKMKLLAETGREVLPVSIIDDRLVKEFSDTLVKTLKSRA